MKAIIIDDEPMARQLLNGILQQHCPQVEVVDLCPNLPEGVKSIHKNQPDLVFLDIEMPGHSGLELLDFFNDADVNFSIIFTTAYNQYAIKAFKLSAIDYILKPLDAESIIDAVNRFEANRNKGMDFSILKENLSSGSQSKKLAIHTVSSILFLELKEICFLKADGAYTQIHSKDGNKIISSRSLKYFEQTLSDHPNFIRCHKSFIVNVDEITEYVKTDGGSLLVNGKHEVAVSSDKWQEVLEKITV
ncbi:MAG: response regulator transcription factor [Fluviicola sp.]|nr:response regulator transcription factor [Fluviicola sp.]